jgi:hypothetical protein
MKKSILLVALFLLVPVLLLGQENPNFQQNYFITTVELDSGTAKSVRVMFPRNPVTVGSVTASRFSITNPNGSFWNPGYYRLWVRGDTTAAGDAIGSTDSLTITVYELMFDGSRGDQTSTVVADQIDWTVDTWHGPFVLTIFGPAFGMEAVLQKSCVSSADTSEQTIIILY